MKYNMSNSVLEVEKFVVKVTIILQIEKLIIRIIFWSFLERFESELL